MRLWIQLSIAMTLAALGPLVVTGVRATQISERQAVEQSKSRHAQTALKTSSEAQRWLESQADFLSGWMTLFPDLSKRSPAEQVGFLRAVYRAMPAVESAALMTPEGRLWTDNSGTVVPPQFLQEGLRTGENRRGRTEKELERALQGFPKIAPSMTQYGSFYQDESGLTTTLWTRGTLDNDIVLMVELNLDPIAQWFVSDAEQYSSVLMDNQGGVLTEQAPDWVRPEYLQPLLELGDASRFQYTWMDKEFRGAVAPVPSTPLRVVIVESAFVSQQLGERLKTQLFWAFFVSLGVAVLGGIVLSRPLSRPVELLRTAALDVASGTFGKTVKTGASGELGQLTDAFNFMSRQLETNRDELLKKQAEIESFNRVLQDRVDERTRDLREAQAELVRTGQLAAVAQVGAGLAHELNNPLSGIFGLSQVLHAARGSNEAVLLQQLEGQAERCRDVVETMLRLSEPSSEFEKVKEHGCQMLLNEVEMMVSASFQHKNIELVIVEPDASLTAAVPSEKAVWVLSQVLQCLRAGMQSGASLHVSTVQSPQHVVFVLRPSVAVASGASKDDWMASGAALWVARQMLHQIQGTLMEPEAHSLDWKLLLPRAHR